jgi:hypothetical protein
MIAAPSPSIIPAHMVTHARGGASFSRDFSRDRGAVEVAPNSEHALVSASASIVTTKTGTETQFWALRTSLTVFHAPSRRFITAADAVYDLPFDERTLSRLHDDETWVSSSGLSGRSLSRKFRACIDDASKRGEQLAYIWKADLVEATEAENCLRRELSSISHTFQRAINQTL